MDFTSFTNDQLITEAMDTKAHADELYAHLDDVKRELLRRHQETGEVSLENETAVSSLTREALSEAWLKRQYGFEKKDLPPECITEKVSPVIDWDKVKTWLADQGMTLDATWSVRLKHKPMKAK
ncbi:hypothetical protein V5G24_10055 [Xanthobacter sp. VTT E-85241]|uniref:hypothetical protein n=1 Tax=Roseixanthobacter finlandensis TaxID=3119922 RepID=UPI00372676DE